MNNASAAVNNGGAAVKYTSAMMNNGSAAMKYASAAMDNESAAMDDASAAMKNAGAATRYSRFFFLVIINTAIPAITRGMLSH